MNDSHTSSGGPERNLPTGQHFQNEQAMHLEVSQLVTETSRSVPRAALSAFATAGLWALRGFAVVVSLMVIYTFIGQLR